MDEALRLAYLAAMDIPVWVLRDTVDAAPAASLEEEDAHAIRAAALLATGVTGAAAPRVAGASSPAPRDGVGARSTDTTVAAPPVSAAQPDVQTRIPVPALLLVMAGRCLFIAEAGTKEQDERVAALASAIAFAFDATPGAGATMQRFDPAVAGMGADHDHARDMLLGLLGRLTGSAAYANVIVLGPAAARPLLGWSEQEYAERKPLSHRVVGLEADVLVTIGADTMLRDCNSKAQAWRELCQARGGHGG